MLQGLGQHLRCCGVDVVILDNSGDHSKAIEVGDDFCRLVPFTRDKWRPNYSHSIDRHGWVLADLFLAN